MSELKLTFANGETVEFPFGPESSLTVETPDGVNAPKRGSWSEIVHVEYGSAAKKQAGKKPAAEGS